MSRSDGSKRFKCPECPKYFQDRTSRKSHVLVIHKNAGRFRCEFCQRTFEARTSLEVHERIHTGEKPFACKFCSKKFPQEITLKIHVLDMHAKKKFVCKICGKGFGREKVLQRHMTIHQQQLKCNCGKEFQRIIYLRKHLANHPDHQQAPSAGSTANKTQKETLKQAKQQKGSNVSGIPEVVELDDSDESSGNESTVNNDDFQDDLDEVRFESDERSVESEDESAGGSNVFPDEQNDDPVSGNEMPAKKVKTENSVADEETDRFDDGPAIDSQAIIEREFERRPSESSEGSDSDSQDGDGEESDQDKASESDETKERDETTANESDEESHKEEPAASNEVLFEEERDIQVSCDEVPPKVKTENSVPDEVGDMPTLSSQREFKREHDLDGQTEDEPGLSNESNRSQFTQAQTATTAFDCYDFSELIRNNQSRMKAESDQADRRNGGQDEESEDKTEHEEETEGGDGVSNEERVYASDDAVGGSAKRIKREPDSDGPTIEEIATVKHEPVVQNEVTAFDCYDFNDLIRSNQSRLKWEKEADGGVSSVSTNLKVVYDVEYRAPE